MIRHIENPFFFFLSCFNCANPPLFARASPVLSFLLTTQPHRPPPATISRRHQTRHLPATIIVAPATIISSSSFFLEF